MNATKRTSQMETLERIASEMGYEVSTYPGPEEYDSYTVSMINRNDDTLPEDLEEAYEEAGISPMYGCGAWPTLWCFAAE